MHHSTSHLYISSAFSSFPLKYKIQESYIQEQLFGYIPTRRFFIRDLLLPRMASPSEIFVHHPLLHLLLHLQDPFHKKKRSIYLLETTAHKKIYLRLNPKSLFILRTAIGEKSETVRKRI